LVFQMRDFPLATGTTRQQVMKQMVAANKGTDPAVIAQNESLATEFASKYACSTRKLLIREATCKENPARKKAEQGYLHCAEPDCVVTYTYPNCLRTHLQRDHGVSDKDVEQRFQACLRESPSVSLQELQQNERDADNLLVQSEMHYYNQSEMDDADVVIAQEVSVLAKDNVDFFGNSMEDDSDDEEPLQTSSTTITTQTSSTTNSTQIGAPYGFIVFDLETTGFTKKDKIVQLGACRVAIWRMRELLRQTIGKWGHKKKHQHGFQ